MTPRWNRIATVTIGAAVLAVTTACSSNGSSTHAEAAAATPSTAATSAPAAAPSSPADVATAGSAKLGTILVDAQGRTLYRFDKDSSQPPTSNCTAACATAWPPVPATTNVAGISQSLIGSITRADGTTQLTVGGWPIYRYAKDDAAGDTYGQGVKGVWWTVAPDGSEVKTAG